MPKCFISYSWDSDSHRAWVRALATQLQDGGVFTHLDQWDVNFGADLAHYMESAVRESDYVLLVCTEKFAEKANSGAGGVGYEKTIVTGEIFSMSPMQSKFVPILRSGQPAAALPSFLKSRAYLDFRSDDQYSTSVQSLLRHIHQAPEVTRPTLGNPAFRAPMAPDASRTQTSPINSPKQASAEVGNGLQQIQNLIDFAFSSDGLDLPTKADARTWALSNIKSFRLEDIPEFKRLVTFAYASDGLDLPNKSEARKWALANMNRFSQERMEKYRRLATFAFAFNGLDLPTKELARKWAIENLDNPDY